MWRGLVTVDRITERAFCAVNRIGASSRLPDTSGIIEPNAGLF
jgi:hypothetical protein